MKPIAFSSRFIRKHGVALRQAVLVRIPPDVSPFGLLICSLPRNRPVAWFPKVSIHPLGCLRPSFSTPLRLPTLGYTVVFPLGKCAFARVFSHLPRSSIVKNLYLKLPLPPPEIPKKEIKAGLPSLGDGGAAPLPF